MAENNDVGILAFGAYLPRLRLSRKAVADASAWFNPALKGLAKGERAICNWDEDSVTMAVEAARDCLTGVDRGKVASLAFASNSCRPPGPGGWARLSPRRPEPLRPPLLRFLGGGRRCLRRADLLLAFPLEELLGLAAKLVLGL